MRAKRKRRTQLLLICTFFALAGVGASAMGLNSHSSGDGGLLPPLNEIAPSVDRQQPQPSSPEGTAEGNEEPAVEDELAIPAAPEAASLAGPPASVVERFAQVWANRDVVLTPAIKKEMVGLSAGVWASAVFRQARLTLPAIEGVRADGEMVMMKLTSVGPKSKTALVVTSERLLDAEGVLAPPRYALYLARLDEVSPGGYAITAWEPEE
ncbi:MAG TPA: hypothetical protein VIE64_00450 [Solirubrobacterales bacterium]|jgi:hypothetical protein